MSRQRDDRLGAADADDGLVTRSLLKGVTVLSLFDVDDQELSADEIAGALEIPKATAYRLAHTLEVARFLTLDSKTGKYHLGPALAATYYFHQGYSELVRMTRPYLLRLAEVTQETVNLAVEVDGEPILVDQVIGSRPFSPEIAVGRSLGDIANSSGKIFAAFKDKKDLQSLIRSAQPRRTPNTITDPELLRTELEKVAREGLAYDTEERSLGVCAVSAPVRDQKGKVVAAVSVVVPKGRYGAEEAAHHAEAVRKASAALSAFLGFAGQE